MALFTTSRRQGSYFINVPTRNTCLQWQRRPEKYAHSGRQVRTGESHNYCLCETLVKFCLVSWRCINCELLVRQLGKQITAFFSRGKCICFIIAVVFMYKRKSSFVFHHIFLSLICTQMDEITAPPQKKRKKILKMAVQLGGRCHIQTEYLTIDL